VSACGTSLARPNGLSHRSAGVLVHAAAGVPVRLSPSMSAWYSSRSDSSNLGGPGRAAPRKEVAAPVERLLSCEIALSWLGGDVRNRYYGPGGPTPGLCHGSVVSLRSTTVAASAAPILCRHRRSAPTPPHARRAPPRVERQAQTPRSNDRGVCVSCLVRAQSSKLKAPSYD